MKRGIILCMIVVCAIYVAGCASCGPMATTTPAPAGSQSKGPDYQIQGYITVNGQPVKDHVFSVEYETADGIPLDFKCWTDKNGFFWWTTEDINSQGDLTGTPYTVAVYDKDLTTKLWEDNTPRTFGTKQVINVSLQA